MTHYIPLSEFNKKQQPPEPMVCSVCGARQGVACCSIRHVADAHKKATGETIVAIQMVCNCPRCSVGYGGIVPISGQKIFKFLV